MAVAMKKDVGSCWFLRIGYLCVYRIGADIGEDLDKNCWSQMEIILLGVCRAQNIHLLHLDHNNSMLH